MPIFMDRHDVSESVTAENVAQLHQEDLLIQHKYSCRGLTYWFDDVRKTAFCLIEAPNKNAIIEMHEQAHGEVPNQIIEVDATVVESFLGRIEDPVKALDKNLNIINEPAFRTIMMISIDNHSFNLSDPFSIISDIKQIYKQITEIVKSFNGNIVQQNEDGFLVSFKTVTEGVLCALKICSEYRILRTKYRANFTELSIGVNAGIPVTEKESIFEETIKLAQRMCVISAAEVVISNEVKQLFESENFGEVLNTTKIHELKIVEDNFLTKLMEFTENEWQNPGLKVDDFEKFIGISKSKFYREMIRLTGKSPNVFLLHYRLRKSLQMLLSQKGNISDVAFASGFNSPSYYAKCFRNKYGIIPSEFVQQ